MKDLLNHVDAFFKLIILIGIKVFFADELLHSGIGKISARSCNDLLFSVRIVPLKSTQTTVLFRDKETVVEKVENSLTLLVDDNLKHVEELGSHTDFVLINEKPEHSLKRDWALFVQGDVNRGCLLSWLVQLWVTVEEY